MSAIEPSSSQRRYAELLAATLCNFAQFGTRIVVSPLVLAIATTFAVTKTEIGFVLTALWGVFALVQFPSGVLANRYSERAVITVSLSLAAVSSLAVTLAPTFSLFTVGAIMLGLGTGLYFSVGAALVSKRFEHRQSQALAVHSAGGPIAGVVLPVVATSVAAHAGWRAGVGTGTIAAIVALGVSRVTLTSPASSGATQTNVLLMIRSFLGRSSVLFTTLVATAGMYALQSVVSFLPTFLQEYHRFGEGMASVAFSAMFLLTALCMPIVGRLADNRNLDIGISGPMLVAGGSLVILLIASTNVAVAVGTVGVGAGLTWGGAVQSRFMQLFETESRSSGFGLGRTVFVFFGATGNVCTGYLSQQHGWAVAFGAVSLVLFVTAAAVLANRMFSWGL